MKKASAQIFLGQYKFQILIKNFRPLISNSSVKKVWDWGAAWAGCLSKNSTETILQLPSIDRNLSPLSFLCFPGRTFHSRLITQAWLARWTVLAMAWLYIKPTRETTPDGPTGDPVDSDPTRYIRPCWTDGLIPTGFCFPHLELWPFSPVLPVQVKHSRNHAYPRCGLWPRTTVCHLHQFYLDKAQNYYLALIKLWLFCLKRS